MGMSRQETGQLNEEIQQFCTLPFRPESAVSQSEESSISYPDLPRDFDSSSGPQLVRLDVTLRTALWYAQKPRSHSHVYHLLIRRAGRGVKKGPKFLKCRKPHEFNFVPRSMEGGKVEGHRS
jgi:hypothetical protein